ncbi:dihydrodipicolinate synthase family protein [Oerskovia sp. NPDC060287]|uniref:dihydrodipicolinate synthase family protein n=1 Tax=Oerskovia sp. NPDC060287 TaxID=3347095 RepID=UPI0036469647
MTVPSPFSGLLAYPITPVGPGPGAPDLEALAGLVASTVRAGVDGVTVLASSGAGTSFSPEERAAVVGTAVRAAREAGPGRSGARVPVHVAVAAPATTEVVRNAVAAQAGGADGLVLTPFSYVPLVDDEVVALFEAVAAETDLPLCFYNRPAQSGYDATPEVLAHLARHARLLGLKDPAARAGVGARLSAVRGAVDDDAFAVGLSGDLAMIEGAFTTLPSSDAWHTGMAALVPAEYVRLRRAHVDGRPLDAVLERSWLLALARELGQLRPVAGLHALAELLGVSAGRPRGPVLATPPEQGAGLRSVLVRRPAAAAGAAGPEAAGSGAPGSGAGKPGRAR